MRLADFIILIIVTNTICGTSAQSRQEKVKGSKKPHIIMIVADDLGWDDVSFHGSAQIPTPTLDELANNGVILNSYYVSPMDTPTRASFMTGKYPLRLGLQHDSIHNRQPMGVPLKEKFLPQHLKALGYSTHAVGKWQLGFFAKEYTPTSRGFDSFYGFWGSGEDYFNHVAKDGSYGLDLRKNMDVVYNESGVYGPDLFAREADKVVDAHDTNQPLFLYYAQQAVRVGNLDDPLQAPKKYLDRVTHIRDERRRTYAAMVTALDDSVKSLVEMLKRKGLYKNSVIVFTTDNGAAAGGLDLSAGSNYPLRGAKNTMWEGGVRAVGFVHSPLIKKNRRVCNEMIHATDWLPTFHALAGGERRSLKGVDGFNQWKAISEGRRSPRYEILHGLDTFKGNKAALRVGEYKLVMNQDPSFYSDWFPRPADARVMDQLQKPRLLKDASLDCTIRHPHPLLYTHAPLCDPTRKPCLFNIKWDPCEYHNLADFMPNTLKVMLDRLNFYLSEAAPVIYPKADDLSDPNLTNGVWITWRYDTTIPPTDQAFVYPKSYDDPAMVFNATGRTVNQILKKFMREQKEKEQREKILREQREKALQAQRDRELKEQREKALKEQRDRELRLQREEELRKQREQALKAQRDKELRIQKEKALKAMREEALRDQREKALKAQREKELREQRERAMKAQRDKELRAQWEQAVKEQREKELRKQREKELRDQALLQAQRQKAPPPTNPPARMAVAAPPITLPPARIVPVVNHVNRTATFMNSNVSNNDQGVNTAATKSPENMTIKIDFNDITTPEKTHSPLNTIPKVPVPAPAKPMYINPVDSLTNTVVRKPSLLGQRVQQFSQPMQTSQVRVISNVKPYVDVKPPKLLLKPHHTLSRPQRPFNPLSRLPEILDIIDETKDNAAFAGPGSGAGGIPKIFDVIDEAHNRDKKPPSVSVHKGESSAAIATSKQLTLNDVGSGMGVGLNKLPDGISVFGKLGDTLISQVKEKSGKSRGHIGKKGKVHSKTAAFPHSQIHKFIGNITMDGKTFFVIGTESKHLEDITSRIEGDKLILEIPASNAQDAHDKAKKQHAAKGSKKKSKVASIPSNRNGGVSYSEITDYIDESDEEGTEGKKHKTLASYNITTVATGLGNGTRCEKVVELDTSDNAVVVSSVVIVVIASAMVVGVAVVAMVAVVARHCQNARLNSS